MDNIANWWNGLETNWKVVVGDALGLEKGEDNKIDERYLEGIKSISTELVDELCTLEPLSALKNVEEIYFNDCRGFTDLMPVRGLKRLRVLCIENTDIKSLRGIEEALDLKMLMVSYTDIDSLSYITKLQKIEHISLMGCRNINDISVLGTLPNLREINIDNKEHYVRALTSWGFKNTDGNGYSYESFL